MTSAGAGVDFQKETYEADLRERQLGGLQVTMLGYGATELRGARRARDISDGQAETILRAVLDAGINYIDTSIDYGLTGERIGRYVAAIKRSTGSEPSGTV